MRGVSSSKPLITIGKRAMATPPFLRTRKGTWPTWSSGSLQGRPESSRKTKRCWRSIAPVHPSARYHSRISKAKVIPLFPNTRVERKMTHKKKLHKPRHRMVHSLPLLHLTHQKRRRRPIKVLLMFATDRGGGILQPALRSQDLAQSMREG